MVFHYDYLYEKSNRQASPGWYIMRLSDPGRAAEISQQIDDLFRSSPAPTKTGTERAFQASFITMWGNIAFLVRAIGTAVFFAILLVAANAMMMSARERTREIAVLKTLGFSGALVFALVIGEALAITLLGGAVGLGGGKALLDSFKAMDTFLPGFSVKPSTMALGLSIAAGLGILAGLVPAWQAMRLPVVTALRRLA
jgi:putative ABC transport system permease protein